MAKKKAALEKVQTPRGPATSLTPLSPYQVTISASLGAKASDPSAGIVQNTGADWFGPLNPMRPIAPPEVAGRRFDYAPGYNLVTAPRSYEVIGFPVMRALAESFDILRLVIETRKDQLCRNRWKIRVKEDEIGDAKPGKGIKATKEQQSRIDEIEDFFVRPDGVNRWRPWLRSVLEDVFVLDAPALYCQRNRGGKLIALKQVDGATVKVLLDDWGRTPMPYVAGGKAFYPPAYQQTLKGFPAVNYSVKDLLYRPYNRRAHKAYGYSPVEQIIITVNIALRRQMFQLSYYTEGNVPEALIGTPDQWTPEQVMAFQTYWDTLLTGNLATRRRAKFVPGGVAKTFIPTKEPDLKNPMDEWLARVVCFAFSIAPTPFVQQSNRATANTAQEVAKEEGVEPLKEYLKEMVDDVIEGEFGSDDLEFAWDEDVEVDQTAQTNLIAKRVEDGLMTINEARGELGEEQSDDPAADVLMVKTGTGYVPIAANTIEGKLESQDKLGPPVVPGLPAAGGAPGSAPAKEGPQEAPLKTSEKPKPGEPKGGASGGGKPVKSAHEHGAIHKAAGRRLSPVPFDRPASVKAERRIKRIVAKALAKIAKSVAAQVRDNLAKAKNPQDIADGIARDADLSAIEAVIADIADELAGAAEDAATYALAQLGPNAEADLVDQVNERAVATARQYAAELVGMRYDKTGNLVEAVRAEYRIDESTRDMIRTLVADGLEQNIGSDAIASSIEEAAAFSEERAQLIAHTEIARANSMAAVEGYRGARDGLGINVKKEWLLGPNPCPICEDNAADGPIDLDDEFSSGDDEPPAHPHCLPGDTVVSAQCITGATKRWYDGNLVIICTASGRQLAATPNHQILTDCGWVSAERLDAGSNVIGVRGREWISGWNIDDVDDAPAAIEQIFKAFSLSGQAIRHEMPIAAEDFHGDGAGSEVAIIWANSFLFDARDPSGHKHIDDAALGGILKRPSSLASGGTPKSFIETAPISDLRAAARSGELAAIIGGHREHSKREGLPSRSHDAGQREILEYHRRADAELFCNLIGTKAGGIFFDEVVDVVRRDFSGHVFNLQTQSGWYVAEGIITHNCECSISPVVIESDAAEPE